MRFDETVRLSVQEVLFGFQGAMIRFCRLLPGRVPVYLCTCVRVYLSTCLPVYLCTCLLVHFFTLHQSPLLLPLHGFNSQLSFHGREAVGLFFNVNQFHRAPRAGVSCAAPGVVLLFAARRVGRPAGIKRPIRAFEDVTVKRHAGVTFLCGRGRRGSPKKFGAGARPAMNLRRPAHCSFYR